MPSAHDHPILSSPPPPFFLCHPYHNFLTLEKPAYSSISADSPPKDSLSLSINAGIANSIADHLYPPVSNCEEDRTHRKSGKRSTQSLISTDGSSFNYSR